MAYAQAHTTQWQSGAVSLHLFSNSKLREEPCSDPIKHLQIIINMVTTWPEVAGTIPISFKFILLNQSDLLKGILLD